MLRYVLVFQTGLRRSYAGDRHAVGRTADVVHAELGTELNGAGLATMLATDTYLKFRLGSTAFLYTHAYELTNTLLVKDFERIGLDNAMFFVELKELGSIITRVTECHLSKVVSAEREEVGYGSNLISGKGRTGVLQS